MDIEVVIEGVSDTRVANAIKEKIRQVCKDAGLPGEWSVVVAPSETRGQWDLGLQGPLGRRFASFTEQLDQLPVLVAQQLRAWMARRASA